MSFSFSIPHKSQSTHLNKTSAIFSTTDDNSPDASNKNYISEFNPDEPQSKIKPIAPIPDTWHPTKNLTSLSQSNGSDSSLQFELDKTGSDLESSENSISYGLNLRQAPKPDRFETTSDLELRKLREDLAKLPEGTGLDEFTEVPVKGYGVAILSGYGWKEGMGIGRNAKEDVKICEFKTKIGRGGLGFVGELPDNRTENSGFDIGKEVKIVGGREIGKKGKVVEVKNCGEILILRLPGSSEKVEVRVDDVAEMGSYKEESCLSELNELRIEDRNQENESD